VATRLGATRSLQHRAAVASPGELVIHENLGKSVNTHRARAHTTTQDALSRGIYLSMLRIFGIAVDDEDARALVATLVSDGRHGRHRSRRTNHRRTRPRPRARRARPQAPGRHTPHARRPGRRARRAPRSARRRLRRAPRHRLSPGRRGRRLGDMRRHAGGGTTALPLCRRQPAARPGRSILLPGRGKLRNSSVASAQVNVSN
jgi:hypothetical protein